MPDDEVTMREVVRRLDEITRQQRDLMSEIRKDREALAATYVRRDVYDVNMMGLERRVADVERDADESAKGARAMWTSVGLVALGSIANLFINVVQARGG